MAGKRPGRPRGSKNAVDVVVVERSHPAAVASAPLAGRRRRPAPSAVVPAVASTGAAWFRSAPACAPMLLCDPALQSPLRRAKQRVAMLLRYEPTPPKQPLRLRRPEARAARPTRPSSLPAVAGAAGAGVWTATRCGSTRSTPDDYLDQERGRTGGPREPPVEVRQPSTAPLTSACGQKAPPSRRGPAAKAWRARASP